MARVKQYQITRQSFQPISSGQAYPTITAAPGWRLHSMVGPLQRAVVGGGTADFLMVMESEVEVDDQETALKVNESAGRA